MYNTVRDFHLPPLTSVITVLLKKLRCIIEILVFEDYTWNLVLVPRG
jgi:hypothetical protein